MRSFNTAIVDDPLFSERTSDCKLIYFILYNHPKNHLCGLLQISEQHLAIDCSLPLPRIRPALAELEKHDFIRIDAGRQLVWVPEMRRVCGSVGDKIAGATRNYLKGLRPCPLVAAVYDAFGVENPNLDTLSGKPGYPIGQTEPDPDTPLLGSVLASGIGSVLVSGSVVPPLSPTGGSANGQTALPGIASDSPTNPPAETPTRKRKKSSATTAQVTATATMLLSELSSARIRVDSGCDVLRVRPANLEHLELLLTDGYTVAEIRHVIAVCEAEARNSTDPHRMKWFNASSPFRPGNVEARIAFPLSSATASARSSGSGAFLERARQIRQAEIDNNEPETVDNEPVS